MEINLSLLNFIRIFSKIANKSDVPLIIVFEDIHWIDESSFNALNFIISNINNEWQSPEINNLIILLSYRIGYIPAANITKNPCFHEMVLDKLTDENIEKLINSNPISSNLTRNIKNRLVYKANGNPFYIEEWLKLLEHPDGLSDDYANNIPIPESINSIILTRIDRLGKAAREFLQKAAVIGFSFDKNIISVIENMLEIDPTSDDLIENLVFEETIYPVSIEKVQFEFKHQLIRDVVYNTILRRNRRTLHKLAAEIIEDKYRDNIKDHYFALAKHYEIAAVSDKTLYYLEKSEKAARDMFMNEKAIQLNMKILNYRSEFDKTAVYLRLFKIYLDIGNIREADEMQSKIDAANLSGNKALDEYYLQKIRLFMISNKYQEAKEFHQKSIAKFTDPAAILQAKINEMEIDWNLLELSDYELSGLKLLKDLENNEDNYPTARLLLLLGFFYVKQSKYKKALDFFEAGIEKAGENKLLLRKLHQNTGSVYARTGKKETALAYLHKALKIARATDDKGGCCKIFSDLASVYQASEEFEKSLSMYHESYQLAIELADKKQQGLLLYNIESTLKTPHRSSFESKS